MNIFSSKGQSLLECVMVVPLFFILLGSIIVVFQQQSRSFQDENTHFILSLSEGHFELEERQLAHWANNKDDKNLLLEMIADNSLNSSRFFTESVDLQEGVFIENQPVREVSAQILSEGCSFNAIYNIMAQQGGEFNLKTCAQESGYQRVLSPIPDKLGSIEQNKIGFSLFYPYADFSWFKRNQEVVRSVHGFLVSSQGLEFNKNIASLFNSREGAFNVNCFLEPFRPQCRLQSVGNKFSRAAKDSANLQISACFFESSLKCTGSTVAMPVCLAANGASLIASIAAKQPSPLCPALNRSIKSGQWSVQKAISAYSLIINDQEIAFRKHFLIIN
ncbi:hypothetical protein [Fluviispira multicolorata]|uniref:Uncharacterized protein n=1 Tax=Fluviispira multicolorata TaxID=2654512 RepID=A0A833JH01_9BACT|nr:hypothetical protein [Fluviispira multicolorata]KAB8033222.1 hypothetical protein GCL57_00565 [Fluviispira multicolorata]